MKWSLFYVCSCFKVNGYIPCSLWSWFYSDTLTVHDKTIQKYEKKKRGKKKRLVGDQPSLHSASRQVWVGIGLNPPWPCTGWVGIENACMDGWIYLLCPWILHFYSFLILRAFQSTVRNLSLTHSHIHISLTCTLEADLRYTTVLRDSSKDTIRMNRELNPQICNYLMTSTLYLESDWLNHYLVNASF